MPGNIADIPLSVIASWPTPNYVDPVTRSWMPAFVTTWQVVATLVVAGRLYVRGRKQASSYGLDDIFIVIAWVLSVPFTACAWLGAARYGNDRHTWDVPVHLYPGAACVGWIAQLLFVLSSCAAKISVLLFYRRIVMDTSARKWKYLIWVAIAFVVVYCVIVCGCLLGICTPLEAYWKAFDFSWSHPYHCIDAVDGLNYAFGLGSVITDIYTVALPTYILSKYDLDVPRRQVIALNIIFALGMLVAGAGIARTYFFVKLGHSRDTSWAGFDLYVWSVIECELAIIVASVPALRAFFRRYLSEPIQRTFGSSRPRSGLSDKVLDRPMTATTRDSMPLERTKSPSVHVADTTDTDELWPSGPPRGSQKAVAVARMSYHGGEDEQRGHDDGARSWRTQSGETVPRFQNEDDYVQYCEEQIRKASEEWRRPPREEMPQLPESLEQRQLPMKSRISRIGNAF